MRIVPFIFTLLAVLYKCIEYSGLVAIPSWASSYLEDLLAIPVILFIAEYSVQKLHHSWSTYRISKVDVTVVVICFAVYFEALLPCFSNNFTSDPIDVVCYTAGGFLFSIS